MDIVADLVDPLADPGRELVDQEVSQKGYQNAILGADSNIAPAYLDGARFRRAGIARVTGSASSVESRWVRFIQGGSELQPPW